MIEVPPDDARPQRVLLQARADLQPAVLALIDRAQRVLRCLQHDLSAFGLSQAAPVAAIERFLRAHALARVRLLIDDARWFEAHAARLKLLQRRYSHALEVRLASSDDPVGEDAYLIADDRHVLLLQRTSAADGELWLHNEPRAQPLIAGFDRRWDAAAHNLPVSPLGL
ncbi:MAG TPA: hypothetical protein VNK91_15020 [Burkholderiaceae bacterium]|jgi:hypothetical protein|nr:hypothetical protein [Burkholderiaceae bacterium]